MPLSCRDEAGAELVAPFLEDHYWAAIHRVRPRPVLLCPFCNRRVHAKASSRGFRFFAHDAGHSGCSLGETLSHLSLKAALARATRDAGWHARLEVAGDGWRTDVMAISPDGRRKVGFEVQLSAMTRIEGELRTARLEASDLRAIWVTLKAPPWLLRIPSVRLQEGPGGTYDVVEGCVKRREQTWIAAPTFPMASFVRAALTENLQTVYVDPLELKDTGWRLSPADSGCLCVWSKPADIKARQVSEAKRREEESARRAKQLRHEAYQRALVERQRRLVPAAMELALQRVGGEVWAGEPARCSSEDAQPSPHFAMGVPIWTEVRDQKRVWAVVCPDARKLSSSTRLLRDVTLFAETGGEAARLRAVLPGCKVAVLGPTSTTIALPGEM